MRIRHGMTALVAVACAAGGAQTAGAAGFYIKEQSITGLGRAFAGEAAVGEDASTIYFNPAAMTELERAEALVGGHLLIPRSELTDTGSQYLAGGAPAGPILGGDGGNPYDPTLVPNGFVAAPFLDDKLWLGVGVTAPFGLANEYDRDWFGRYDSIETELTTINIQPSLAYRINEQWSVGGGIDIQYADARLTSAAAIVPNIADALVELEGDDWSVGFNLGVLFKPLPTTRIGLHYRSEMNHELEGDYTESSPFTPTTTSGGKAELKLPSILEFGIAHELTPKLTLLGEFTWYGWDNFDTILIEVENGAPIDVRQEYRNSYAVAVGAQYAVDDNWTVRAGFQYDETPTQDGFRSTRTPDGDRYWLTAGVSYELSDSFVIDAAYAHIFISKEDIDLIRPGAVPGLATRIQANTEGSVDIVSVGLRYRF